MSENQLKIDLFSEEFNRNPYPMFKEMRENEPIYRTTMADGQQAWVISRYEDAVAALKEPRFIKDPEKVFGSPDEAVPGHTQPKNILMSDPPDHERLRKLVQKAFTPRTIEGLRGRIQEIADDLLDRVEGNEMNLIDDFAFPLPIIVICEMLGVPSEDRGRFRKWSNVLIEGGDHPNETEEIDQHWQAFMEYLAELVASRRQDPRDDLITGLIQVEEQGDHLSEAELYDLIMILIIAGHETTVNLIGNGMLALLQHPDQMEQLKKQPELMKSAIEEFLRYNGPVQMATNRWAGETFEFRGTVIPEGDLVLVALDSADHDPDQFEAPETFDITRESNRHLAFGKGIHFCLGAPLARLEGEIAVGTLLRRLPGLRMKTVEEHLQWRSGLLIRGVKELPVVFDRN